MLKKIFKAAKDILKSPVGQLGIGLLLPGSSFATGLAAKQGLAGLAGKVLTNPALLQSGIGLLAGDKPTNVLRNLAYGSALGGIDNLGQPGGFMQGAKDFFGMQPTQAQQSLSNNIVDNTPLNVNMDPGGVNVDLVPPPSASQGFLRDSGLIVETVIDEITGKPRAANFFEKYGNILKLGSAGASIAAAALGAEDAAKLYDPEKNPYLKTGSGSKDFYEGINPIYSAKGGGISDFPRKTGMIDGPGDGQSDDIPAMLSDGEFVMTKQAVMAAGNGDRDKGTKQMYAMMNGLEDKAKEMGIGKF